MYPISCWRCRVSKVFLLSLQLIQLLSSSSLPCCLPVCTYYQLSFLNGFHENGQKKLYFDCPLSFSEWSTSTAVRKKILLVSWLPLSLPHLCHHAHSVHPSLLLQPSLSCGFCLSLPYRSCLLSAFVKQYNCNDRQTMARKKPSCLKSCLDPL